MASGAVAQLGERLAGSQKVRGSSPLGSTSLDVAERPRPEIEGGAGVSARPTLRVVYAPTIVIVRSTSAVVAVFAVTVTR